MAGEKSAKTGEDRYVEALDNRLARSNSPEIGGREPFVAERTGSPTVSIGHWVAAAERSSSEQ